jgi:hypothetical protein
MLNRNFFVTLAIVLVGCPGNEPSASGGGDDSVGGSPVTTTGPANGGAGATSVGGSGGGGDGPGTGGAPGGNGAGGAECDGIDLATSEEHCGECNRPCFVDENVKEARCVDGLCRSFCNPGWANLDWPPAEDLDDGCETEGSRVFVTKDPVSVGTLMALSGADERCQFIADNKGLGGEWLAWLSDESDSPETRFVLSESPYYRLDGVMVADSFASLVAVSMESLLLASVSVTENGNELPAMESLVWTGTTAQGSSTGSDCLDWTTNNGGGNEAATVGIAQALDSRWTIDEALPCNQTAHLYCFEQ